MKIAEMNVELLDYMGDDISVVNAARVSFDKESAWWVGAAGENVLSDPDEKLIKYLARNNHWTPFGHCFATFRVKAPIFVARQLVKHQVGLVWNEVSRRYVDSEPEFWLPKEWRGRPVNAKQGSDGIVEDSQMFHSIACELSKECVATYSNMIACGVAPEQARMVLPQNTLTEWIWSGTMMAFARVCRLRLDPHAQQETQEIAQRINAECKDLWPVSWEALMKDYV